MTYKYAFKSSFGYNCSVREGKIYNFSSRESLKYLLEVNIDLIEIIRPIKLRLRKYLRRYIVEKRFLKRINLPSDLFKRQLGILNFSNIIKKIEYEMKLNNQNNNYERIN